MHDWDRDVTYIVLPGNGGWSAIDDSKAVSH